MKASEVHAAIGRLEEAHREISKRDRGALLAPLCELLESWGRADSPPRQRLVAELPRLSGFSPAMVEEGLSLALEDWSGDALRALVEDEIPATVPAASHAITSVLLAGSIPMPSLLSIVLPLSIGSTVLVKPASRDPLTPLLVANSIASLDPLLGRCVEIASFDRHASEASEAFLSTSCVVATGSDETLARIEEQVRPSTRVVEHAHRFSIAVVGPDALRGDGHRELAGALARDVALWDQLGCLSPISIYAVDVEAAALRRFAACLAEALAELESRWPRGEVDVGTAVAIVNQRNEAELRAALGQPIRIFASDDTRWSVVLEADAEPRPAPLHRFVRIHPVASSEALLEALAPLSQWLAGVAIAGFGASEGEFASSLLRLGASRTCRPGHLQCPPLDWQRDNQPLLRSMLRG